MTSVASAEMPSESTTAQGAISSYARQRKYYQNHPWTKFVHWARCRCSPNKSKWKPFYYDRGIRCHITSEDTKRIWIRDDAHLLKRPSLDRINSDFSYVPWNIRFIEFEENVRMARDKRKSHGN